MVNNLTLKNIAKVNPSKKTVAPGFVIDELYWAPIGDFTSIAALSDGVTDIDVLGLITSAHTFAGTKGFVKLANAKENTGKYKFEDNGGNGFGNFKVSAEIMVNGFDSKVVGLINQAKYQPGIALVKLMNGNVMQIGSETFPAYIKGDYDSLTNQDTNVNGIKFVVEAVQDYVLRYDSALAITIIT